MDRLSLLLIGSGNVGDATAWMSNSLTICWHRASSFICTVFCACMQIYRLQMIISIFIYSQKVKTYNDVLLLTHNRARNTLTSCTQLPNTNCTFAPRSKEIALFLFLYLHMWHVQHTHTLADTYILLWAWASERRRNTRLRMHIVDSQSLYSVNGIQTSKYCYVVFVWSLCRNEVCKWI